MDVGYTERALIASFTSPTMEEIENFYSAVKEEQYDSFADYPIKVMPAHRGMYTKPVVSDRQKKSKRKQLNKSKRRNRK